MTATSASPSTDQASAVGSQDEPTRPGVVHEPPTSSGQPSTQRPEFTALLDQLRAGTRPPRPPVNGFPGRAAAYLDPLEPAEQPAGHQAVRPEVQAPVQQAVQAPVQQAGPPPIALAPTPGRPAAVARPAVAEDADPAPEPEPATPARRQDDQRVTADRRALRTLGVPAAWTRRLRQGDRFGAVLRMLERMPDVDIDPDVAVVAVVGSAAVVGFEAHRTALDLPLDDRPRPVVTVPAVVGTERATATSRAQNLPMAVVAIEAEDYGDAQKVLETLTAVKAGAVVVVVDATRPLEETQRWIDTLGQVDALAVDGAAQVADPAAVLQLGLPVLRLDGVPVDRVTWTAVLCAQLEAASPATLP